MQTDKTYRDRVLGCWLGKAVGGTLGLPLEGQEGPFDLSFYDPVPTKMLPNDDLDLQVLWACVLDAMPKPRVDRNIFGQAWLDHVAFPWDEYGVAIRNLHDGIKPPLSGSYDNWFANGMGAAIRSEIWACLAPGKPDLAGAYAYEDACVDHAGEGIWSEVFLARLESLAFVETDKNILLDTALIALPVLSLVRRAINDTRIWWEMSHDWPEVRQRILAQYGHENFTDVTMNLAFTILGWLAGGDDFSRSICIAANCGKDTDCTAATVGALMGIIDPASIPERWIAPIGRSLVVDSRIKGIAPPKSIDEFTDLVLSLQKRLDSAPPSSHTKEQSAASLGIPAELWFDSRKAIFSRTPPKQNSNARSIVLPGSMSSLRRDEFVEEFAVIRYKINLPSAGRVRIVLNSHEENRLWIDGTLAFAREYGRMCPAIHRPPPNQSIDLEMTAGPHELISAIARPSDPVALWLLAVGDAATHQWICDVFLRSQVWNR
jgi:ADP-ribosylglycohydrolase